MIQPLLIVCFALLFTRLPREGGSAAPWLDLGEHHALWAWLAVWGSMLALWLGGDVAARRARRRLDRRGDLRSALLAQRVLAWARLGGGAVFVAAVLGVSWVEVVRDAVGNRILIDEAVAVLPLLAMVVGGWWSIQPVERRLHDALLLRQLDEGLALYPMPSRWRWTLLRIRHDALLVLVPLTLMLLWAETLFWVEAAPWRPAPPQVELALHAALLAGVGAIFLVTPVLLRSMWDTVPLGPGPLRERIERMLDRHSVKVREVLVWRTGGTSYNAAVMGLVGPMRYVLLTDGLLDALESDQVEAVAAHEVAHVRRRHIPWLVAAVAASALLSGGVLELAVRRWSPSLAEAQWAVGSLNLVVLLAVLWVVGFVSRRFEWQADAFAAQDLSGLRTARQSGTRRSAPAVSEQAVLAMSGALARVAYLGGVAPHRRSWRHGSIALRRDRLGRLVGLDASRLPIDRQVRRLKSLVALALLASLAMLWFLEAAQ